MKASDRRCPNDGKLIKGHPNKKFCNSRCKDQYHNRTNPRGYGAQNADCWNSFADTVHPFSSEAFEE